MVKAYQRYLDAGHTGQIAGSEPGTLVWFSKTEVLCGVNDEVIAWNLQSGTRVPGFCLKPSSEQIQAAGDMLLVTQLTISDNLQLVAVGHSDGSIRVYDISEGIHNSSASYECSQLVGHRSAVTALQFFPGGQTLISGSKDTDVLAWDLVAQSGLCRFRGHTDQITCVCVLPSKGFIVSGSKDSLLKVWDLQASQMCLQTAVAGNFNEEVWSLTVNADESIMVSGASGSRLAIYTVSSEGSDIVNLVRFLDREVTSGLVSSLSFSREGYLLIAGVAGSRRLELWRVQRAEELDGKQKRKLRKKEEKAIKNKEGSDEVADKLDAKFTKLPTVFAAGKIKSVALSNISGESSDGTVSIAVSLADNRIQSLRAGKSVQSADVEDESGKQIHFPGHRDSVRFVDVSADDAQILSLSSESVIIWNSRSLGFMKVIHVSQGVVARFLSGNQYILVATKTGNLHLFDVHAGEEPMATVNLGSGALNSLELIQGGAREVFATVGAEKALRYWTVSAKSGQVSIDEIENRKAELPDEGTCLAFSDDKVAVGLLDSTIQLLHSDTHKVSLSLYGHKLPVTCVKFSTDGSLLVSGSADKNIKVWSPKFGNIIKSFKAHDGTVSSISFIPDSNLLFSSSRDGSVNLWDLDLPDSLVLGFKDFHKGEVLSLAVSQDAAFVVSCGSDRSIRKLERTSEQMFAEEERERREEMENERELADKDSSAIVLARASRKTVENIRTADRLIELLEGAQDQGSIKVAKLLSLIPASDLNEVVLALPGASARLLLSSLCDILEKLPQDGSPLVPIDTLLSAGLTIIQAQARYLVAEPGIAPLISKLKDVCITVVNMRRDRCSFANAAVSFQICQAKKRQLASIE